MLPPTILQAEVLKRIWADNCCNGDEILYVIRTKVKSITVAATGTIWMIGYDGKKVTTPSAWATTSTMMVELLLFPIEATLVEDVRRTNKDCCGCLVWPSKSRVITIDWVGLVIVKSKGLGVRSLYRLVEIPERLKNTEELALTNDVIWTVALLLTPEMRTWESGLAWIVPLGLQVHPLPTNPVGHDPPQLCEPSFLTHAIAEGLQSSVFVAHSSINVSAVETVASITSIACTGVAAWNTLTCCVGTELILESRTVVVHSLTFPRSHNHQVWCLC